MANRLLGQLFFCSKWTLLPCHCILYNEKGSFGLPRGFLLQIIQRDKI
ncbi:hypothetical protein PaecuDRAFT_4493 [Paenibacillus curdlanolyticus YK9]|uniref:Uncharacterized protein n=1 Tax=Paenibacillus curdlanolyticus YK9 TaxID=717606 RepID=E0IFN3_9BACL|nr:hypothetical protein PaecuDRAFT_4493 [Paenibacillus curdlanolyticus YK9]